MDACSGYLFDGDRPVVGDAILSRIRHALVAKSLSTLNGSFGAILQQADSVQLITDRLGSVPIYYARANGRWEVDFDFWALAARLSTKTLNPRAASQLLTFNYVLAGQTMVDEIAEALPGSVVTLRGSAVAVSRYWRHDAGVYDSFDPREASKRLGDILQRISKRTASLTRAMGMRKVGIGLTEGRDSRLLGWMLAREGVEFHSFTTRDLTDEQSVAQRVATILNAPHTSMPMWHHSPDPTPAKKVLSKLTPTTMFSVSNHPLNLAAHGSWSVDGFVASHLGDIPAGSHFDVRSILAARKGREAVSDLTMRKHARISADRLRPMVRRGLQSNVDGARADFVTLGRNSNASNALGIEAGINYEQRQHRFILRDYQALSALGSPSLLPLHDREWLDFWGTVPPRWQVGTTLYNRALSEHVFVDEWKSLSIVPINGQRLSSLEVPEMNAATETAKKASNALTTRWNKQRVVEGPAVYDGIGVADWIINVKSVREGWNSLGLDTRRSIETVARFTEQLQEL